MNVKCKVTKKVFNNGDFYIFGCSPIQPFPKELKLNKYFSFTIKGELSWITEGKEYTFDIEEESTDKYGTSYKVVGCESLKCEDLENLNYEDSLEILTEITTERQAENILKAYPNFIYKILTDGKDSIDVSKIYGVGEAYLNVYARELNTKYKYLNIMNKFKEWQFDITDAKNAIDMYSTEEHLTKALKDNPYEVLIKGLGRSFEKADKHIIELREDLRHSEQRCAYLILSVLERNEEDGNTRIDANDVYNYILNEYPQGKDIEDLIVDVVTTHELFYYDEETKNLAIMQTYLAECRISDFVKDKINNPHKLDIDYESYRTVDDFTLTDEQLDLLKNFCEYDFMILAGYAGGGKTSSVKNLIRMMEDNGITYTLLSPTGKASRVLAESTNRTASTIHRKCLKDGYINSDCIILDESGMINLDTFIMLLNCIENENAKVIMCGDPAQLASIGLSKIFDDLIKSNKVPITMLTKVFRYKSNGALFVATNIRNGNSFFEDSEMIKYDESKNKYSIGSNYSFYEREDDEVFEEVINQYTKLLNKGIKPKDIVVLSPFNKYKMGTYELNRAIQLEVNPPKANEKVLTKKIDGKEMVFRVGDIVINTKNDYNAVSYEAYKELLENSIFTESDVADKIVVNGQMGIVREVLDNGMVVQFDEELIYVSSSKLNNVLLGYSISTHKSQGSSIPHVISIVSGQHKRMLSRGLLYVMDTRSQETCINIGSVSAFENGLSVVDNDLRDTWLLDLMTK